MTDDPLRAAALAELGPKPTPARRLRLVARLRQLADEQERLAEVETRQQTRPAAERVGARKPKAGPGRGPGDFVRIERADAPRQELPKVWIYVGRALWYAAGSPSRLDVQRLDRSLVLVVATGDAGYGVMRSGMPRIVANGARDLLDDLPDGRYAATVVGNRIEVGEALDAQD